MNLNSLKTLSVAAFSAAILMSCNQDQNSEAPSLEENMVAPSSAQVIEGQYIVVFKNDATTNQARMAESYQKSQDMVKARTLKMVQEAGIKADILNIYSKSINGATLKLSAADAEALRGREDVDYIEEDKIVMFAPPCGTPNGAPCDGNGGGGTGGSQETPYGITRVNGGVAYGGSGIAWVIDTGIDLDHEDLNVDASKGFNAFTSGKDGRSLDDGNGHGSHVAGTIAAKDNSVGVIGVAPGATVVPVKVLDSRGSGSYSGVIAGVDHVAANGKTGDVANMSLGGPVSQALDDAVVAASSKVKFALAAGNETDDANNHSPARANGPNIYTISAMDSNDDFAYFSNYGNPPVDYCTPGVAILSTWKGGGYNTISGTSMASPHAAGILLLGNPANGGTVNGDPDGNPDTIMVH
ncbi:S8 family peptidase [Christiangramia flava]|uniref:Extracellular alkaline serine protease n=1 Tax=Christiangramia flava JLT2011 TaxID=1229726 RepID=A0A1L7I172_9FLAO|nr:S8 family peptidase [Christiangramia flava]APU67357.1 extracellular alkaline serine protease [Christiangramia flava JLT2011]OSS39942.1 alkaline serine protease [Christiangramia flava JLT2011]